MEPSQPPQPEVEAAPAIEGIGADQPGGQPTLPSPAERAKEVRARRRRRIRQFLVIALCVVALLGLGGVGAGFLYYDQATKPDLSTPEHVTRKYLEAYLVDRDDYAARQYQCADTAGLADVRALRNDIDSRQKTYQVTVSVSLDSVREATRSGGQAEVLVDIVLSAVDTGDQLSRVQHWAFVTHDENGWRVCTAHVVT